MRQKWFYDERGQLHREDGPAIVVIDDDPENVQRGEWLKEAYYIDSKRHREDGPAVIHRDGTEEWYKDGKLHREDGPAVTVPEEAARRGGGLLEGWYQHGVQHREDGPAIRFLNGEEYFFLRGKKVEKSDLGLSSSRD